MDPSRRARTALVGEAAAALRRALPRPPRWLLASRFGADFLGDAARRAPPHEVTLPDGAGRLLARAIELPRAPLLALDYEATGPAPLPPSFGEALPLLVGGKLGCRGALHLLSGQGLAGFGAAPAITAVGDWLRFGDDDPLRWLDAAALGARFPELRGGANGRDLAARSGGAAVLARHGAARRVVAATRRGPSGPTDAELAALSRLGAEIVVEGSAAELVAARHQGLRFVALALVLDDVAQSPLADPSALADAAATLLPRVARLLPELIAALESDDGAGAAESR